MQLAGIDALNDTFHLTCFLDLNAASKAGLAQTLASSGSSNIPSAAM